MHAVAGIRDDVGAVGGGKCCARGPSRVFRRGLATGLCDSETAKIRNVSYSETSPPQSRASVIWPHLRVREFAHLRQELRDRRRLGSYAWLQSPREACQTNRVTRKSQCVTVHPEVARAITPLPQVAASELINCTVLHVQFHSLKRWPSINGKMVLVPPCKPYSVTIHLPV